jgi:hypothetical protein
VRERKIAAPPAPSAAPPCLFRRLPLGEGPTAHCGRDGGARQRDQSPPTGELGGGADGGRARRRPVGGRGGGLAGGRGGSRSARAEEGRPSGDAMPRWW